MKVILTAFGGKLRGEPMDWPDDLGETIRLTMDMDGHRLRGRFLETIANEPSCRCVGVFERTGDVSYNPFHPGVPIWEYHLVKVEGGGR